MVENDPVSGESEIKRYVAGDGVGNVVNLLSGNGQIYAGIVQEMAEALFEGAHSEDNGELITGTMSEYAVPKASMVSWSSVTAPLRRRPSIRWASRAQARRERSHQTPVVANADIDAVSHLGISHLDMPMTPERVWRVIASALA